jgi:hypothetical protein
MGEPIESTYFNWLCAKVMKTENSTPSLTYWTLLRKLHGTEFIWLIPGDENRADDGLDLRHEFLSESRLTSGQAWLRQGCSVLEMLIAFSRKAVFQAERSIEYWFWLFIENLGLSEFNDASDPNVEAIEDIVERFIWRTYKFDGTGGMCPLQNPSSDQTEVEIWYQFSEYLLEQEG